MDEALSLIALGMPGRIEVVKGRPFSGEAVTETSTLSEGSNRTNHRNVTNIYRDGEGRTRREQTIEAIAPSVPIAPRKIIFIFDPVKGKSFVVDPKEQVTREFLASSHNSQFRDDRAEAEDGDSNPSPPVTVEPLGQKTIGGLLCTGIRRTSTPSRQGKDPKTIDQAITEAWSSVDLRVVVDSLNSRSTIRIGTLRSSSGEPEGPFAGALRSSAPLQSGSAKKRKLKHMLIEAAARVRL